MYTILKKMMVKLVIKFIRQTTKIYNGKNN